MTPSPNPSAFAPFADAPVAAERVYAIDPGLCVLSCRRSMEGAVRWMYPVDGGLALPWDDKPVSLMSTEGFVLFVDQSDKSKIRHSGIS
ncbi:MAG: hypothetical protein IKP82_07270 [Oscillospiraceae bacterium]|nr:hypothetical protein [Oscillospiraceae bacterium]